MTLESKGQDERGVGSKIFQRQRLALYVAARSPKRMLPVLEVSGVPVLAFGHGDRVLWL